VVFKGFKCKNEETELIDPFILRWKDVLGRKRRRNAVL